MEIVLFITGRIVYRLFSKNEKGSALPPGTKVPGFRAVKLDENQTHLVAKIIPIPMETTDDKGRHLSMEIVLIDDPTYLIVGDNFGPKENLTMNIQEMEAVTTRTFVTNEKGFFLATLIGKEFQMDSDKSSIEIIPTKTKDPLRLNYT